MHLQLCLAAWALKPHRPLSWHLAEVKASYIAHLSQDSQVCEKGSYIRDANDKSLQPAAMRTPSS